MMRQNWVNINFHKNKLDRATLTSQTDLIEISRSIIILNQKHNHAIQKIVLACVALQALRLVLSSAYVSSRLVSSAQCECSNRVPNQILNISVWDAVTGFAKDPEDFSNSVILTYQGVHCCTKVCILHLDLSRCPLLHKSLQPSCITDCTGSDTTWELMMQFCELYSHLTLKVLFTTTDARWEGMWDVGSTRHEPALLPPCPTIRVLSYRN